MNKQFLVARQKGIGGSDAASIAQLYLGDKFKVGAYKTPLQIYLSKVVPIENEEENNSVQDWGNFAEPSIARRFANETGYDVTLRRKNEPPIVHCKYPFLLANPDAWVDLAGSDKWLLEIKTAIYAKRHLWGKIGTCDIPPAYKLQCAHYAIVTDVPFVDIAVLIGGSYNHEYRAYRYWRDGKLEKKLMDMECDFWERYVLKNIPPPPMSLEDTKILYPKSRPLRKQIDSKHAALLGIHKNIKIQIDELINEKKTIESTIKAYMGEADTLSDLDDKTIATWKSQERPTVDTTKLKKDFSDIFNQVKKISISRPFLNKLTEEVN